MSTLESSETSAPLLALLDTRRVVVCVGCGGVGKTTIAAALGVLAAQRGRRVLCLTVDPARRLASALGLEVVGAAPQPVPAEWLAALGASNGALHVMMLDSKAVFDGLVARYAPSAANREAILADRLVQHLSQHLSGTRDYMAMEQVLALLADERFDLVLLDTPPTSNALDFLDAPDRLVQALDSPAMRWFAEAWSGSRRLGFGVLARGAQLSLKALGRLTGGELLADLANALNELSQLLPGFSARAKEVGARFRGPDFAYVLVSSPAPAALEEVGYFAERLRALGMVPEALVVNRVRPEPTVGLEARPEGVELAALAQLLADESAGAAQDRADLAARPAPLWRVPLITVPELAGAGTAPMAELAAIAQRLAARA